MLEQVHGFFRSISKEDRVAVIHHTDTDGICSGVLLYEAVRRLRGKAPELRINQAGNEHALTSSTVGLLRKEKITCVLITDISSDEGPDTLLEVSSFARVLLIDHHKLRHDFIDGHYEHAVPLVVKPQMLSAALDPAQYSCSQFVYDLLGGVVDLDDKDWVACAGAIGDMTFRTSKQFVKHVHQRHQFTLPENPFDSPVGQVAVYLTDAEAYDPGLVGECFAVVLEAQLPNEVLDSSLRRYHLPVQKELHEYLNAIEKRAEFVDDLILYNVQPKFNIKSALSTLLSTRYPHHVLVLYTVTSNRVFVSLRCSDYHVRANDLIEFAVLGIPSATGGGHIPAAGGSLPEEHLSLFLTRIKDAMRHKLFHRAEEAGSDEEEQEEREDE